MLAVYTIILAPVGEELVFRGLTYRFARKALPFWGANILQAALFGVMHLNLFQGLYAFFLGTVSWMDLPYRQRRPLFHPPAYDL